MPRPFEYTIDYAFVADLCGANGWGLALCHFEDDEWALRVYDERPIEDARCLAGVKFTSRANLDVVADVLFETLRARGLL